MNSSTLSAQLQRNIALAVGKDESSNQKAANSKAKNKASKKSSNKVFEYKRNSQDLQIPQSNQPERNKTSLKGDDYIRYQNHQIDAPHGSHMGSFGLSEIKSPHSNSQPWNNTNVNLLTGAGRKHQQQPVDINKDSHKLSAYQIKRQQAHSRQNNASRKEVEGIVGRRVDAPHIIVPSQGPAGLIDFESREQGSTAMMAKPTNSTMQMMVGRGHQTVSLSPKHSPWKKSSQGAKSTSNGNYARGKPKNLFGQVKLALNQQNISGANKKAAQKNFKSQPGKHGEGGKNTRGSKSMEQVRHFHRQTNFGAGGSTQNVSKAIGASRNQEQLYPTKKSHQQQAPGRKSAMQSHHEKPDMSSEALKQRRSGAGTRQQRSQLNNFLDSSMAQGVERAGNISSIQIQNQSHEQAQNQITLNILTATADQFVNQANHTSLTNNSYPTGAKCKSAAARHNPNDQSRQLIQAKYLNFQQREANHHSRKQRDSKSVQQHRVNLHRAGGTRARTAHAAQASTTIQTRGNSKSGVVNNPFQRASSSQGRASGSGGAASVGHSRAFGASKNQTIEIELRRRSKSRQGTSGVLSDTPDKSQSQKRARSGGSSNKRKQQLLGASASFSPRSRATTQFQEARSLLFENQSSGLSVNSKKHNLNQLLNNLEGRHKKQKQQKAQNQKQIAGSQEYIAAPTKSSGMLQAQQQAAICPSAVNLSSAFDPTYNLSSVLLQAPTDPNSSLQQYHNMRSTIAETQVGDGQSQQHIINVQPVQAAEIGTTEDSRSVASKKYAHLNASLGRILNQSALSMVAGQQRGGKSQSPKGSRDRSKGAHNQVGKGSNVISASNTSRIDKIIQENLKKQGKKTLQRLKREQEEEQVSRKKKAELELVNERVRNANKEKVQRRKLQQMLLMQTNNTAKAGRLTKMEDPITDALREEMTRMLDELPENAIFKSQKGGKKTNQENISIQQQSASSHTKLTSVKDTAQPKQLQARTQKIELKFNSQQRIDGLFSKVQRQQPGINVKQKTIKNREGLPPKQLVVNRLGHSKKEDGGESGKQRKQRSQERSALIVDQPMPEHQQLNGVIQAEQLLQIGESQVRMAARFKDHRQSYGLEFIDIRKEINAELKQFGGGARKSSPRGGTGKSGKVSKENKSSNLRFIGSNLDKSTMINSEKGILIGGQNLRGSKSQKQVFTISNDASVFNESTVNADLNVSRQMKDSSIAQNQTAILKPHQIKITPLRIKTSNGDKKLIVSSNGIGVVLKKEKIRKFMLKKQKQKLEQEEKKQHEEIQKTLKVHQNLYNLDKFAKKKLKILQPSTIVSRTGKVSQNGTQGSTLRQRHNLALRKNMTLVHDQQESDQLMPSGHNLTITPSKNALEVSEPSFNISAKLNQRVSSKQLKKMNRHYQKVSSNGGTQNIHLDPEIQNLQAEDQQSSGRQRHRRSTQSRGTDQYANKSINQLAPQFENSTSAKTLRAQLKAHKQTSSQSPPPHDTSQQVSRADPSTTNLIIKCKGGPRKTPNAANQNKEKNLKVAKKTTGKHNRKRGRSTQRRSTGDGRSIQVAGGKHLNVRVPAVKIKFAHMNHRHSHHHQSSLQRSSIQTLESHDSNSRYQNSYKRHRMPSSLRSIQHMTQEGAAKIIQKEVRKFLQGVGFYHARQIDSPDHEAQISLFIEKRSRSSSKKSKSKSKSRSGSRGYRQKSPSLQQSERNGSNDRGLQETTIIAELSGLKQTDLFQDADGTESEMRYSEIKQKMENRSHKRSHGQRKSHQKSSSSERESSAKNQFGRKQLKQGSLKINQEPKITAIHQQPIKQLNPIFKDMGPIMTDDKDGKSQVLHEILSVQTPQSLNSKRVINIEKPQSQQSLSCHRISESEFEFKQAHSSVESNSVERLGMHAPNGQLINDGASQSSNSLFDRNAFQQYSQKKLKVIMQDSEHSKLIKFREDVLRYKEHKERKHIKKLFNENEVSPRTFQQKQKQIDRWVQVQKQEIEKTKTNFKEEWEKTVQMIEDTQKNVDQMKSKMNIGQLHQSHSGGVSANGASANKPNTAGVGNQLNNFNSQSCQSLSSHRNYVRGSSANGVAPSQLALSGLGEHQRSILIDDPPKSYRSGHQELSQIQILPISYGAQQPDANGDDGHGSVGLLSSRRSANGQNDQAHAGQSLLQYMEQRLASHNEQKQTSLSELKSKNGEQTEEEELKYAMEQIEIKAPTTVEGLHSSNQMNLASSQQMVGLSNGLDKVHTRKPSANSAIDSDNMSHQPSAEFLERLERVNKQEPFISSQISDKLLGSADFTGLDDPMLDCALISETADALAQSDAKKLTDQEEQISHSEFQERGNFKNQVMTIKDFGGIDSKRTSQQSETSNERDFMKMLAQQKNRINHTGLENKDISPTAEHLEEPSIMGKRETDQANDAHGVVQNIKIADMLKHQSKDLEEIIKEQSSHRSDNANADSDLLLQEPAIISSSQTLEVPNNGTPTTFTDFDQSNPNLVQAKIRPNPNDSLLKLKLEEIKELFKADTKDEEAQRIKIVDSLVDDVMKSLVADCVQVDSRDGSKKEDGAQGGSSQQNHDVYYVDQLQSEKEERKEWIELRQRHLIENDLIRIDQYVNEIVDALLQFDIDLSSEDDEPLSKSARERREKELKDNYHVQFLRQLTQPIQKSSSDVLQTLQTSEIGSYKHFETTQDLQKYPIIPVNLYLEIEKAREEALLARKGPNMSKQTQMVWESIHIQNKSFFDAINESLMKFRPYGLTGEPMPWSNKIRRLQTKVDIGSVDTERLFQMVKQEVFRWSQAFCGSLPSPVFCFNQIRDGREKEEFSDEMFQENREKRLTQVLSAETVEQEHHWLNYEYEEAQVKVDLSDMILEHLVDELASFLKEKSGVTAGLAGPKNLLQEESKVEIYELMQDEPEFAKSSERLAVAAAAHEINAFASGPLQIRDLDKSAL